MRPQHIALDGLQTVSPVCPLLIVGFGWQTGYPFWGKYLAIWPHCPGLIVQPFGSSSDWFCTRMVSGHCEALEHNTQRSEYLLHGFERQPPGIGGCNYLLATDWACHRTQRRRSSSRAIWVFWGANSLRRAFFKTAWKIWKWFCLCHEKKRCQFQYCSKDWGTFWMNNDSFLFCVEWMMGGLYQMTNFTWAPTEKEILKAPFLPGESCKCLDFLAVCCILLSEASQELKKRTELVRCWNTSWMQ